MSGKSKEEVAFELVSKLKGVGVWGENNMAEILDMYSECLDAVSGNRARGGQPSSTQMPVMQTPAMQAPVPQPAQAAPHPTLTPQMASVSEPQYHAQPTPTTAPAPAPHAPGLAPPSSAQPSPVLGQPGIKTG